MANKKCPKCGEDNPAEAVMCWACYTPLTASAGAAMGAGPGMGGGGTATMQRAGTAIIPGADDGAAKKQIDPRIFFVAGGLLLAGLLVAFTQGMFSGGGGDGMTVDSGGSNTAAPSTPSNFRSIPGTTVSTGSPGASQGTAPNTDAPVSAPTQPWTMVVSPSPRFTTATFAIAPSQPGISPEDAKTMARNARQQYISNGKWTSMQIVVFSTADSGQTFKQYMSERKGQPLGPNDYASLAQSGAWNNAVVYYETINNGERARFPSKNPTNWWSGA